MKDPFATLDNLNLNFHGFQINLLKNDEKLRKAILEIFVIPPLLFWALLGSDSTADQLAYFIFNIPNCLLGKISLDELFQIYQSWYGLGTHWSAAVIYGLLLVGISKHLHENLGIRNSENLCMTCGYVGFSIAVFEFFWQFSYAYFQNQWWVVTFQFPQARILIQNLLFAIVGIIVLLHYWALDYKLNVDKKTILFFLLTAGLILTWWYYPFQTTQLTVETHHKIWISSPQFPQTMYTIEMRQGDSFGELFYVADEGVHLVNNLAKIFMTLFFYNLFKVKRRQNHKYLRINR